MFFFLFCFFSNPAGIIKKTEIELYWSTYEPIATPYFGRVMSRNRFTLIWRFLQFRHPDLPATAAVKEDSLYKVRPVLDYLLDRFQSLFTPGQNIGIDEGMMKWRGRLHFRVYQKDKPVKYGVKSYILCDSATGYCWNLKPYCGKGSTVDNTVKQLLGDLKRKGYNLFMDNFYMSVRLSEALIGEQLRTNVCGTMRMHRGEPLEIKKATLKTLKVGEHVVRHNGNCLVIA